MKSFKLLIIVHIWSIIWLVSCIHQRVKNETIQEFDHIGQAIAVDQLIREYEKEHKKFYKEEIRDDYYLTWPNLNNKMLVNYCTKYLQYSLPTRTNNEATATRIVKKLHYGNECISNSKIIEVLQCKVPLKSHTISYYVTRAPEENCVYSLKCTRHMEGYKFTIINKYCDFEDKPLIHKPLKVNPLKRKKEEIISVIHRKTGQPIAKDEYLLQFEMEHQDMVKNEEGKHISWPHVIGHENINTYCYQYMKECAPRRAREGVTGSWKTGVLHYQKINNMNIDMTTVTCHQPIRYGQYYHLTKAPEINCVYALLRKGPGVTQPAVIIFKHCDFENPNDQPTKSHTYENDGKKVIMKNELKEET